MSLYNGPPRPGARGGRGEFSWENVKSDRDRDYYLGHSVKASVGRWQKGKDLFWYTKGKADAGVSADEIEAVKQRERDMMAEALGIKPKAAPAGLRQPSLEKHEVERLLKGDQEETAGGGGGDDPDRIAGLGFKSGSALAVREAVQEVLPGTGLPASGLPLPPPPPSPPAAGGALLTAEQLAALDKAGRRRAAGEGEGRDKRKKHKKDKDSKKQKKKKKEKRASRSRSRSRDRSRGRSRSRSRSRSRERRAPVQRRDDAGWRRHDHHQQQQQQQAPLQRHGSWERGRAREDEEPRWERRRSRSRSWERRRR